MLRYPKSSRSFLRLPNAKLSGGVAVRLSAGLERGGVVKDEHEKNKTPGAPAFFKFWKGLLYSNRLPLNSARERASPDAPEKDLGYMQHRPKRTDAAGRIS